MDDGKYPSKCKWLNLITSANFMLALIVLSSITKKGEIVTNMAPFMPFRVILVSNDNTINGINDFVKSTFQDPRDELKRSCKAKHEERTQRNAELDEFY